MAGSFDETAHAIDIYKYVNTSSSTNKRYKEKNLKEIVAAICAMLNSNGGKVVLFNECKLLSSQMSLAIRILEQSMVSIIGTHQTVSKINFEEDKDSTVIVVGKGDFLITTNYNLYLPSETQVLLVSPLELLENVKNDFINRKVILEPVQIRSHEKTFFLYEKCGFQESKTVMLKHLKACPSKRTRLADRMTGKGNKFSHYVSAFANHSGGHMYYGITDCTFVEGELILNVEDIIEIPKKVEKVINKMIWPEQIGEPKRGKHWDIFFEPVLDKNSKPIPSTFVIVIYIAPCLGGVFTEEPECYEMVEGTVEKMSFTAWKKRILGPVEVELVPHAIGSSITWISKKIRNLCMKAFCILTFSLNNGDFRGFEKNSKKIEEGFPDIVELKLVVLLKKIILRSRRHNFKTADTLLDEYDKLLSNATEHHMFEVLELCARVAVTRPKGDLNSIRILFVGALAKAQWLSPGLVTALVHLGAGTMTDCFDDTFLRPPDVLSRSALQHLQQVMLDCPEVCADLEYKAHITLATFYLGCNLSGELVAEHVDDSRLKQANSSIMAIEQSGRKPTCYREIQLNLVKSIYRFRRSENQPKERMRFMREAFEYSKKSENLARRWQFLEMVSWSKSLQGLITEKLVRTKIGECSIMHTKFL